MNLENFKKELESSLLITKWAPSDEQLQLIARGLGTLGAGSKKSDIARVVLGVVGTYEAVSLEGIDNSDLKALLLMATKVSPPNGK